MRNRDNTNLSNLLSIATLITMLVLLVLTSGSCKREVAPSYSIYLSFFRVGLSQEGVLSYTDSQVLQFYDFTSGQKAVLCNKPNCQHLPYSWETNPDPECNAVLPYGAPIHGLGMHNGYTFIFSLSSVDKTTLYRQNLDGDGREILAEFDWHVDSSIVFKDNMAYLVGSQHIVDEYGMGGSYNQKSVVLCVDLQTGKVKELTEVKHNNSSRMQNLQTIDGKLLYDYEYYDEGMDFLADNVIELIDKYRNHFVYEVDIATETERQLLDLSDHKDIYLGVDDKCFYFQSEDRLKVYSVDREDSTEKVLFEGEDKLYCQKSGDYLFMRQGDDISTVYCYDLLTGKTMKINRTEKDGLPNIIYDRKWFYTYTNEDGSFSFVYMKEEDYLNGKTDYITIK